MDASVLLWCVVAPAVVTIISAAVAHWVGSAPGSSSSVEACAAIIAVTGWIAAVAVTLVGRQDIGLWPEESWQRSLWPIAVSSLILAFTLPLSLRRNETRWLLCGLGAAATAWLTIPSGEGWDDLQSLFPLAMLAITTSCLLNSWSLFQLGAFRDGQSWVLWIALAGLGAATILAASAYGGLAEWLVDGITATFVYAIYSLLTNRAQLWAAIFPATFLAAAGTVSGRFFTWEEHPIWTYGLILFLPTLLTIVDLPLSNRRMATRIIVTAIAAVILLGILAWLIFAPGEEEVW